MDLNHGIAPSEQRWMMDMGILRATTRLTLLLGAFVLLAVAALAAVEAKPAQATMCVVNCWTEDGKWAGGGGIGGGDGGGDPDDGIGGGSGSVGEIPDTAPSGTGWGDARLATEEDARGTCEDTCESLMEYAIDVCKVLHGGNLTRKALCYGAAMATYGACLKACVTYSEFRDKWDQQTNERAEEKLCRAKPSLPQCQ
jgi:hypothetical protein